MQVPQHLKDECQAELERCHAIAVAKYPDTNIPLPRIVYNQRGRIAGCYVHGSNLIKINPILLVENPKEMVENTVSHEFAHCADITVHGIQYGGIHPRTGRRKRIVHGPTFKMFQMLFGRSTSTYHNMDTSNASVKRKSTKVHVWVCGCGEGRVNLTPQKHARQLKIAPRGYGVYMRGHTPKRCGVYTYIGKEGDVQQQVAAKSSTPAPVSKSTNRPWKEVAVEVYRQVSSRKDFINEMVNRGCGKNTASTYHHNVKSGKWS